MPFKFTTKYSSKAERYKDPQWFQKWLDLAMQELMRVEMLFLQRDIQDEMPSELKAAIAAPIIGTSEPGVYTGEIDITSSGPYEIKAETKKALSFYWGQSDKRVFAKHILHPAFPYQEKLDQTKMETKDLIKAEFKKKVTEAISDLQKEM
jgi:hypothetical protein